MANNRPAHDLPLKTVDSPLLRRLGLKSDDMGEADNIKAGDWVKTRVRQNLDKASASGREDKVVMNGVKAKYYS
jgi:hypothetical protein